MPVYHIYCDESRQSKDRFMVLGGLIIEQENVPRFDRTMELFRERQTMHAELKWTKVTNQKLEKYQAFIDYFFALNSANNIHFHAMILDNHQIDHRRFSKGDKEIGFYKFYYQLLLNCFGRKYCVDQNSKFIVHLDQRNSSYKLDDLKRILNNGMNKKLQMSHEPFRSIEPKDSKTCDLIQINDILIGAIGSEKNGYNLLADGRLAKRFLVKYIARKAGLLNLMNNTRYGQNRFAIWNFKLSK